MTELIVIFSVLGVSLILVIYGTFRKNRWGINIAGQLPTLQAADASSSNPGLPVTGTLGRRNVPTMRVPDG